MGNKVSHFFLSHTSRRGKNLGESNLGSWEGVDKGEPKAEKNTESQRPHL